MEMLFFLSISKGKKGKSGTTFRQSRSLLHMSKSVFFVLMSIFMLLNTLSFLGNISGVFSQDLEPSSITCEVSNWQIYLGESLAITGTIDPLHVGVEVTLTFTDPTDTVFNRTTSTAGDGYYSHTLSPYLNGTWSVLAIWNGDTDTMGNESSVVKFLVSTITEVTVKIGRNQTFFTVFQPAISHHYSPLFENIVWSESITSPSGINFTTGEGIYTYSESLPGLGGTITSFNISYNIGVLEGTPEGTYLATAYYDISRQSTLWPYSITFLFRIELRCRVNAVTKYETLIEIHLPEYVQLGEGADVSGTLVPTGGPPIEGANIALTYTKPDRSLINRNTITESDGTFHDLYMPDALGTWSVKASWTGGEDYEGTESLQSQFTVFSPVAVSILFPENTIYTVDQVPLTFSVTGQTSWIGFSLDGQSEVTVTGNTTLTSLSDGMHHVVVYARDTAGNTVTSDVVSFTVDTTPPTISWITESPSIPKVGESVAITVKVTDQDSGVSSVTLSYRIEGGSWVNITMTEIAEDFYEATVPSQSVETKVECRIIANDVAGHQTVDDNSGAYHTYTVIPEFSLYIMLITFIMATVAAVIYRKEIQKKTRS
jgi:hypothetical protein